MKMFSASHIQLDTLFLQSKNRTRAEKQPTKLASKLVLRCFDPSAVRNSPPCVVVRGGRQCVCHSDGAWRWGGRRLTFDGGLVLSAILLHRCDLTEGKDAALTQTSETKRLISAASLQLSLKQIYTKFKKTCLALCTFLLCFLKSLG